MINCILGGLILGLVIYSIIKYIKNIKKGGCSCGQECDGCGCNNHQHMHK
ncbi:FeoB-associated Cys-rich membrane protein [Petroclostridium sp. X23]|nr:FeoB-associated Cys-rich membrane protein [Petroclostridium sp. X23]WHH58720.1 FeoB-associated Cys-rich membrane protein [Petroclostridium sp. X23]